MKISIKNKNRDMLFFYSLIISIGLHLFFIFPSNRQADKPVELPSKKAGITFINFSLRDSGSRYMLDHPDDKKKHNRGKNRTGETGESDNGSTGIKKSSNSGTPASLSKNPVSKIMESYEGRILSKIHRMKYYPFLARRMKQEGKVMLKFTLKKDGTLTGRVKVVRGCEHELLNRAGVKTIYKSLPFPSFPAGFLYNDIEFNVELVYNLNVVN